MGKAKIRKHKPSGDWLLDIPHPNQHLSIVPKRYIFPTFDEAIRARSIHLKLLGY